MFRIPLTSSFLVLLLGSAAISSQVEAAPLQIVNGTQGLLKEVAHSTDRVWDSVVVASDGRIFAQYPRLVGNPGPSLAVLNDGSWTPYPGGTWNSATSVGNDVQTSDPSTSFVSLNGITLGQDSSLWVLDNGIPGPGKPTLANAAKLVKIDLVSNQVAKSYPLTSDVVLGDSVLSSVRVHWPFAYIADAGHAGLIALDLRDGHAKRFLNDAPSLTARRPITIDGKILRDSSGHAAAMNVSMLELSPDGQWLYFQPPSGPLYKLATSLLTDPSVTPIERDDAVTLWYNTPALGGMTIDKAGTLYLADISTHSIISFSEGRIPRRIVSDPRLAWPGNLFITSAGQLYIPVTQINLAAPFQHGHVAVQWPLPLYSFDTTAVPDH